MQIDLHLLMRYSVMETVGVSMNLSCKIMVALWSKFSPVVSSVWSGLAVRSLHDRLFSRCGRWSGNVDERLKLFPLLPTLSPGLQLLVLLILHEDSLNSMVLTIAVICSLFPATWVNICEFQLLTDVLEIVQATCQIVPHGQLVVQYIFWYMTIIHLMHITQPSKILIKKEERHALGVDLLQHSSASNFIMLCDAEDLSYTVKGETLQLVFLPGLCRPWFVVKKQGTKDTCLEYYEFGVKGKLTVVTYSLAQLSHYCCHFVFVNVHVKW